MCLVAHSKKGQAIRETAQKELDIAYLSRLAALHFKGAELERARDDITRIIDMIDTMRAVDTEAVEALAHPADTGQRLRPDEISEHPDPERLQSGAPSAREGFYLVPRVVE